MTLAPPLSMLDLEECHASLLKTLEQRDANRTMTLLALILERWPELTGKYCGLIGSILYQQGQLDVAERLYQDAVEFDGDDITARLHFGIVLHRQGRLAEAKEHWSYIAQKHPEQPEAFFQRALVAFLDQDFEAAEHAARETLSLILSSHPLFSEAHKVISLAQTARAAPGGSVTASTAAEASPSGP